MKAVKKQSRPICNLIKYTQLFGQQYHKSSITQVPPLSVQNGLNEGFEITGARKNKPSKKCVVYNSGQRFLYHFFPKVYVVCRPPMGAIISIGSDAGVGRETGFGCSALEYYNPLKL